MRVLIPLPDRDFDVTDVAVPGHAPGMRQYLARWPGDAYLFSRRFCDLLRAGDTP